MPHRALVPALAVVLVGTAVGYASAATGAPQAEQGTPLANSSLIAGAYANPLDPVMFPDADEQATITTALERHIAACMADEGFTYHPGDAVPRRRGAEDAQYTYSVTDPKDAAHYGFHPASWVHDEQAGHRDSTRPEGYDEALLGRTDAKAVTDDDGTVIATYDPDSCAGRAMDGITPGWAEQDRLVDVAAGILLEVSDAVEEDEDVRAAQAAWSACLADEGYDYASPMDANNDERFATPLPTVEEIPVAIASATCQHESGLLRTWSRVRAELTQSALDDHPDLVTRWLELQAAAAERARG